MSEMKQVIVMRTDLKMRKGKMIAQGAHASLGAVVPYLTHRRGDDFDPPTMDRRVEEWLAGRFTKVCVRVDSETQLDEIHAAAQEAGLITCLITDSGKTEFHGVPTKTCCAIGPDTIENIDAITKKLELL